MDSKTTHWLWWILSQKWTSVILECYITVWIISVLCQLTHILSWPWSIELVSIYIQLSRTGCRRVALDSLVGEAVVVDFRKLPTFEQLFLCKYLVLDFGNKLSLIFGDLISVISINFISLYLVRLYVSFPRDFEIIL